METLEGGWNVLVGAEKGKIVKAVCSFAAMDAQQEVFVGKGASERILDNLRCGM
jgi:hypothetical protein